MTYQPKVYRKQGGDELVICTEAADAGRLWLDDDELTGIFVKAGAPVDGTSGTFAGIAGPGSLLIDKTNCELFINTNTKASPLWTHVGLQS